MSDEYAPLTWDDLVPYEKQQGGYWLTGTDPFGADKRWIPVQKPAGDTPGSREDADGAAGRQ